MRNATTGAQTIGNGAGWQGDEALYDPFCGSGTLPIEAALLAAGRSPFVGRPLACEGWPGLDLPPPPRGHRVEVPILGSDRDARSLGAAGAALGLAVIFIYIAKTYRGQTYIQDSEPLPGDAPLELSNAKLCPQCGHLNPPDDLRCEMCDAELNKPSLHFEVVFSGGKKLWVTAA